MPTAYLGDNVLDFGVDHIYDWGKVLVIDAALPASYAEAFTTYKLGTKNGPSIGAPANAASGRKVTVSAIADGAVSSTATASHWAVLNTASSELLAAGPLNATQGVTNGNTFTLTEFDISLPDAA